MALRASTITLLRSDFLPQKLRWFWAMGSFFRFSDALLLIAGPVALYEWSGLLPFFSSLPLNAFQRGMVTVLTFYLFTRLLYALLLQPFSRIIAKIGLAHTLFVGLFFHILYFSLFSLVPEWPQLLFLLPFLRAPALLFFWLGYHLFFSSEAHLQKLGKELGTQEFVTRISTLVAPLLGALLASAAGFPAVFLGAAVGCILAAICTLELPNRKTKQSWNWEVFLQFLRQEPESKRLSLSVAGISWERVGIGIFWPLFLALELSSMHAAAYILLAASLIALLLAYVSGRAFDTGRQNNLIARISGFFLSLLWLPRLFFASTPLALIVAESADRILGGVYDTFFQASYIWKARKKSVFLAFFHYEAIVICTLIFGYGIALLALFSPFFWEILFFSFFLAGILSLLFRFSKVLPQEL